MKTFKIWFCDFWSNFNPQYFIDALIKNGVNVEITQNNPDIVFYSVFGNENSRYNCKKILFTGETRKSGNYSLSLSFDEDSSTNIRLPLWAFYIDWVNQGYNENKNPAYLIPQNNLVSPINIPKTKFCNFIYNNNSGPRCEFNKLLSQYKLVDNLGHLLNNTTVLGGNEKHKIEAQSAYKFTISFENTYYNGYVTEKILHPFSVKSIPIYWGSDQVLSDFNPKAFIYANKYKNFEELVEYIKIVDSDNSIYTRYLYEPCFIDNTIPQQYSPINIGKRILEIL